MENSNKKKRGRKSKIEIEENKAKLEEESKTEKAKLEESKAKLEENKTEKGDEKDKLEESKTEKGEEKDKLEESKMEKGEEDESKTEKGEEENKTEKGEEDESKTEKGKEDESKTEKDKEESKTEKGEENIIIDKIPKKRGRKPKGGKVVVCLDSSCNNQESIQNIILHLMCNISDINNNEIDNNITNYQFNLNKTHYDFNYLSINNKNTFKTNELPQNNENNENKNNINIENKFIWQKLEKLSTLLHIDNMYDKKSSCFYCTCDFDNFPIYIPKFKLNEKYYVNGCFCSPECACAFLMNDRAIDNTTRFERYYLLNYIYGKIYNYEKNIKPAPNPFYLLDKYYGNLTIQEYRKLLKSQRLVLILDKPLVRSMPELHDDSDDYLLNNKGIPAAINKYIPLREDKNFTKNEIVTQNFTKNKVI